MVSVEDRLRRLVLEEMGDPDAKMSLEDNTQILGVGLSSLDTVGLIVRIEKEFELFFEADEFGDSLRSFGSLRDSVQRKIEERTGGIPNKDKGSY